MILPNFYTRSIQLQFDLNPAWPSPSFSSFSSAVPTLSVRILQNVLLRCSGAFFLYNFLGQACSFLEKVHYFSFSPPFGAPSFSQIQLFNMVTLSSLPHFINSFTISSVRAAFLITSTAMSTHSFTPSLVSSLCDLLNHHLPVVVRLHLASSTSWFHSRVPRRTFCWSLVFLVSVMFC